jgi:hypothetical protein
VSDPICVLLLPAPLERFILRDQAEDLLQAPGVLAVEPPKVRYGVLARLPEGLRARLSRGQARRLLRGLRRRGGRVGVVVIFHPVQQPLATEIVRQGGEGCELWYGRWDRYERAYDADERMRARLEDLHARAATESALTFVASDELLRLEHEAGRDATLVTLSAGDFPAPEPTPATADELAPFPGVSEAVGGAEVVALSLGHLGRRVDWALLRAVCERVPRLVVLLVGAAHDNECTGDEDFAWCRTSSQLLWLGRRSDDEAATLLRAADVGIIPFRTEPFNDAGLPYRILKYAKLGRRTIAPDLAGVRTWGHAVTCCGDADAWAAALRAAAGAREEPDAELRAWALQQTPWSVNRPLWERLRAVGVDTGGR